MRGVMLPGSLLLALGCGGESTYTERRSNGPGTDTHGGRRLEAVFIESADGTGVFQHFYDTELELNCNFERADSDAWRCTPTGAGAARVSEIVYTDAECTEPHAALFRNADGLDGCTPPRRATVIDSCGVTSSVFEIGSESPADTWYRLVDGVCAASTLGTDYLRSLFSVTPIPLEDFASARLRVGDETEGVVPVDLWSDDGASLRRGFRDAEEGFDCRVGAPDERCYPTEAGLTGFLFADHECMQTAAMATATCGEEPSEMHFARGAFGEDPVYYRGGARISTSYAGSPENCGPSEYGVAFEVGPEIPITRFASGQRTTLVEGDLEAIVETVGDASLPPQSLQSTAHGGYVCQPARGSDGELRCLPSPDPFLEEFFADAACTEPVENTQAEVLTVEDFGVCPPEVRVYARGDRHRGPVYAITDGVCALAYDVPPNDGERSPHYVFPREIPATEFAPLFEVVR
jgi:hypothetical protein